MLLKLVGCGGQYRVGVGDKAVHVGNRSGSRRSDVFDFPYVTRVMILAKWQSDQEAR